MGWFGLAGVLAVGLVAGCAAAVQLPSVNPAPLQTVGPSASADPSATPTAPPEAEPTHFITISDFAYSGDLTVPPGAVILVRNEDSAPHDVYARDGSFRSPLLGLNEEGVFTAPTEPGEYPITCSVHPSMDATLIVEVPEPEFEITISNFAYDGDLVVPAGAYIRVRNEDAAPHDVLAVDETFRSPLLAQNEEGVFQAPTEPGEYPITCSVHPSMSGTLTVTAAEEEPPPPAEPAEPTPAPAPVAHGAHAG